MRVYVKNMRNQALMPTTPAKARKLQRAGKAEVVKRTPFTIRLLYATGETKQDVTVGVDAGYAHIGICASTSKETLYTAQVEERTDIVSLLKTRRDLRSARRSRKTRYRKPRFDNRVRSKHKGWLAPSIEQKIATHIRAIKDAMELLPVSLIRIETAEFDIHKLKNPDVSGEGYQHGEKFGHYNTRNYVLWRDSHKCRCCGNSQGKLYVVSVDGSVTEAPEDLRTVCRSCLEAHLSGKKRFDFKRRRHFAPATQMGIMRDTLMKRCKEAFSVPIEQTYGYVTKGLRDKYGIAKSHVNDAYCIAGNMAAEKPDVWYFIKKVRCHNRQIHKMAVGKGGVRKINQAPYLVNGFRLFDKVLWEGKEYFIFGRRKSRYFDIRTLDGKKVNNGSVSCQTLKLLETRKPMLIELRRIDLCEG